MFSPPDPSKWPQDASKTPPCPPQINDFISFFFTHFHQFPRIPPKTSQDSVKRPQDRPKMAPGRPNNAQDGPRTAPRRPQDGPRTPLDSPSRPQNDPRRPWTAPKRPPRRARTSPRRLKTRGRASKTPPRGSQTHPGGPRTPPKGPRTPPNPLPGPPHMVIFLGFCTNHPKDGPKRRCDSAVRGRISVPPHTLPSSGQQVCTLAPFGLGASRRPPPGPSQNLYWLWLHCLWFSLFSHLICPD